MKKWISMTLVWVMLLTLITPVNALSKPEHLPEVEMPTQPREVNIVYPDNFIGGPQTYANSVDESDYEELAFKLEEKMLEEIMQLTVSDIKSDGSVLLDIGSVNVPIDSDFLGMFCLFSPYASAYFGPSGFYTDNYGTKVNYIEMIVEDEEGITSFQDYCIYVATVVAYLTSAMEKLKTDEQKALYLHDYLVQNTIYAEYYNCYSSAGPLFDGISVCEGYAYAFKYLMNLMGIECLYVESQIMNHGWNMIKIDGKYYHVDVTWDDPLMYGSYDQYSNVDHHYFLLTDEQIAVDHVGWDKNKTCNSQKYVNAFWKNVVSPITCDGDYYYYINEARNLIQRDIKENEETVLYTIEGHWPADNGGYFIGSFSGLSMIGDTLYFNSPKALYAIKTNGEDLVKYYEPDINQGAIFGSMYYWTNSKIEYVVSDDLSYEEDEFFFVPDHANVPIAYVKFVEEQTHLDIGESTTLLIVMEPFYIEQLDYEYILSDPSIVQVDEESSTITGLENGTTTLTMKFSNGMETTCTLVIGTGIKESKVLFGDVNDDGVINQKDRMVLTRCLAKWDGYPMEMLNLDAADVNQDGQVNNKDRMILTRYVAKWDGYEELPFQS